MKILNLYAGIGGNRKLWTPNGNDHEITAVEIDPKIAKIYQDFFPNDKMVVADAHQYLLEHFKEFDFIWSSPPCPSHSQFRKTFSCEVGAKPVYPDMKLYEEILLLQGYFKGKYVVENVIGWYDPLITPQELQRHYFWTNFYITKSEFEKDTINLTGGRNEDAEVQIKRLETKHNFNLDNYQIDKRLALRNCVNPELGLHIFQESQKTPNTLFKEFSPINQQKLI
jgi:DNA (cytosine-5)-methyltransferase 1